MDLQLKNRTAIVTGATKGIGRAIALNFAVEGCNVAVCARTKSDVDAMLETISNAGVKAYGEALDVRDDAAMKSFVDAVAHHFGGIDAVVSNVTAATSDWREMFETDLMGAQRLFESALPYLRKSPIPSFTGISSHAAHRGGGAYSSIKSALMSYVKGISWEHAPAGIRANIVSPGDIYFKGGVWDRIERTDPAEWAKAKERNRMGRLGRPEEIAAAVVFLSSPQASFITGANLRVDGSASPATQY